MHFPLRDLHDLRHLLLKLHQRVLPELYLPCLHRLLLRHPQLQHLFLFHLLHSLCEWSQWLNLHQLHNQRIPEYYFQHMRFLCDCHHSLPDLHQQHLVLALPDHLYASLTHFLHLFVFGISLQQPVLLLCERSQPLFELHLGDWLYRLR